MKDEVFPEIPQEEMPQTHSMYEQLRVTSQKWFARSRKSIFDGRSAYQPQKVKEVAVLPGGRWETSEEKVRLMELMREQIEISCQQYGNKMRSILQDQAKKIKVLGDLLVKNQVDLGHKTRIIEQIAQNVSQFKPSTSSLPAKDIKKAEKRAADLENRLIQIQRILQSDQTGQRMAKIDSTIKTVLTQIANEYMRRLDGIRCELEDRMERVEKINQLNLSTSKGVRSSSALSGRDYNRDSQQSQKRLGVLQGEMNELKMEVQSFKRKRFVYDNYKLDHTEQKLVKLQNIISNLQSHLQLRRNQQHHNHHTSNLTLKASQTTQITHTEIYSLTKSKSRFVSKYKSMISSRKMREQSCSCSSSGESEVEETMVEDYENNVERFVNVVEGGKMGRPVLVEVDQTGYAKSVETGMYLVDNTGNGFEFTISQLEYLRSRGVIQLT